METLRPVKPADEPIDYSTFFPKDLEPKHRSYRWLLVTLAILIVAALGTTGYLHYKGQHKAAARPPATTAAKTTAQPPANPPTIPTTSYTSNNFGVTLNYPQTWKVATDSSSELSVSSPAMKLTDAQGQAVTAQIFMTMVPQGQVPAVFGNTDATAVLTSQLIKYTNPTSSQRAQTYLSFVQYASTVTLGGLDGLYVTGNYGYQKDQNIPRTDVVNLNPLVTITFGKCSDATCATGATPLTIASTDWNSSSLSAPILSLLTSLSFQ